MCRRIDPSCGGPIELFDLQNVIDQLPSPFILMGDFNGHHTLWGCEDVNNRGQQLEDLILKNDF